MINNAPAMIPTSNPDIKLAVPAHRAIGEIFVNFDAVRTLVATPLRIFENLESVFKGNCDDGLGRASLNTRKVAKSSKAASKL